MRGEIVSAGGTVETRESRLLAWAGDLFAQLSSQRAELRRSRLEVAGAKEVRVGASVLLVRLPAGAALSAAINRAGLHARWMVGR